ncbi:MAG: 30S ribosomal protein S17 [Desulfohalobiaceae bacterium]|nr:30S ribosomal protein S17 [Desulfohalobiaceae bacterium]
MNDQSVQRNKRVLTGYVINNTCDKTLVVRCETTLQHPLLKKYIRRRKKFMAHDDDNQCRIGDKVQIIECRPRSRKKRWALKAVLEKSV